MVAVPPTSTVLPKSTACVPASSVKLPAIFEPAAINTADCAVMATLPNVLAALVSSVTRPETVKGPLWVIMPGVDTLSAPVILLVPSTMPPPLLVMVTSPTPLLLADRLLVRVSSVMAPALCSTRVPAVTSTPGLELSMTEPRSASVPPTV